MSKRSKDDFRKWFNRDFWRAFHNRTFPIKIPSSPVEKQELIDKVYDDIESARYSPSIPETEMLLNKGHGVTRTVPVFCMADYVVYYFCIKELEDILCWNRTENTFGGWALGGKLRKKEECDIECEATDYGRYSFNPRAWTQAFGEFNSLLYAQLDSGAYSHVLQFDLSNFYDSIRLDTLERSIREADHSDKGWIITLLFYLLNNWNRRNTGLHRQTVGLPQDALADCSRILANFYLQKYDAFAASVCAKAGGVYFRYSDDQMILINDTDKCEGLLLLLTRKLDRFGLRVNQKKVEVWTSEEIQAHRCRSVHRIFASAKDTRNPDLVKEFARKYLAISAEELTKTWNGGIPMLNRLIWTNLESLPDNLFCAVIDRLLSKSYLLMADSKKLVRIKNLVETRELKIDFRSILINFGVSAVHNAFHHEVVSYAIETTDQNLSDIFKNRLRQLEVQMHGDEII